MIIIGLGNPGDKYKKTRHNIGFRAVDEFIKENNFPEFKLSQKFNSMISEGIFKDKKVILAKPQTFMNKSGEAVRLLIDFYKTEDFVIIHDDIDLLIGKIKIIKNRGTAGHKGVESVVREIGSKDMIRLRVGIGLQEQKTDTEKLVLQRFSKAEEVIMKKVLKTASESIESLITEGLENTMSQYNAA